MSRILGAVLVLSVAFGCMQRAASHSVSYALRGAANPLPLVVHEPDGSVRRILPDETSSLPLRDGHYAFAVDCNGREVEVFKYLAGRAEAQAAAFSVTCDVDSVGSVSCEAQIADEAGLTRFPSARICMLPSRR